jgi:hypothetical protein
LDINSSVIDNTYVEVPEDACETIINMKKIDRYLNTDPLTTKLKVYIGEDSNRDEMPVNHNLKLFNIFTESEEMVEKNIAFLLETALQLNPR